MEPMYIALPIKNTFIQFDGILEPLPLLPKCTTAPAEYRPAHLWRKASRTASTASTQTESTPTNTLIAGRTRKGTRSFYETQNQTVKSETDSEPAPEEEPIPEGEEIQGLQEGQLRVMNDCCGVQWAPDSKR